MSLLDGVSNRPWPQQAQEGRVTAVPYLLAIQWSDLQLSHVYSRSVNSRQKHISPERHCDQSCQVILISVNQLQLFTLFRWDKGAHCVFKEQITVSEQYILEVLRRVGGKGRIHKLEHKRREIPAERENQSMEVKKSTAKADQGWWEKCFMTGVQLPPEWPHRSGRCRWQLWFSKSDKLRKPVCSAEGGARELPAARTPWTFLQWQGEEKERLWPKQLQSRGWMPAPGQVESPWRSSLKVSP